MGKKAGNHFILMTEAGEKIKGLEDVWQAYPRPQMKRDKWLSLNGMWELDGHSVRVPFVPESILAEYPGVVKEHMKYVKHFGWPDAEPGKRTLLHFGAVDQIAEVYLNGSYLGKHEGGYFPFFFDITEIFASKEDNILEVKVTDTLDRDFPYGKQRKDRGGMWYTPTSGIWQSVWLEQVPETYVEKLKITPDRKGFRIAFVMNIARANAEKQIKVVLHNGEIYEVSTKENDIYIDLTKIRTKDGAAYEPRLWSVEEPYLYRLLITAGQDELESYTGLRTISIEEINGINRVCLNGKPIFMHGVLDQGYYSDGIFTPAEEAEYERDVLRMKEIGMNMIRKHIKIEPECFYYYCDIHGMLVMQDMVSNGYYDYYRDTVIPTIGLTRKNDRGRKISERQKRLFEAHMSETIEHLYNHPSIVAYTIFNEGWGQFESDRLYTEAKAQDPSRLYDSTSGWFTGKLNDFDSVHIYFGPRKPKPRKRPMFLSEFGGYSYAVQDHVFAERAYGYGACENEEALFKRIYNRYSELVFPYIKYGLCGSIYTQVSDVEDEINGFYTYDRKEAKVSPENMKKIAEKIKEELENA